MWIHVNIFIWGFDDYKQIKYLLSEMKLLSTNSDYKVTFKVIMTNSNICPPLCDPTEFSTSLSLSLSLCPPDIIQSAETHSEWKEYLFTAAHAHKKMWQDFDWTHWGWFIFKEDDEAVKCQQLLFFFFELAANCQQLLFFFFELAANCQQLLFFLFELAANCYQLLFFLFELAANCS